MQRVWNITDDVNPEVAPRVMMVLGTKVNPGRSVKVDDARLARAHKVHADVTAGLLHIGARPSYLVKRNPPRVKLPDGVGRAHGQVSVAPAAEEAKAKVELVNQESFDIVMTDDAGDDKISIIREFRDATGLGVKEATDLVGEQEGFRSLRSGMSREDANELAERLKSVGAKVVIMTTAEATAKAAEVSKESSSGRKGRRR